jgi:hypothetical protein
MSTTPTPEVAVHKSMGTLSLAPRIGAAELCRLYPGLTVAEAKRYLRRLPYSFRWGRKRFITPSDLLMWEAEQGSRRCKCQGVHDKRRAGSELNFGQSVRQAALEVLEAAIASGRIEIKTDAKAAA